MKVDTNVKALLAIAAVGMCVCGAARAGITVDLVQVDNSRAAADPYWIPGTLTFDLRVTVTGNCGGQPNDITIADVEAVIRQGEWYEHPLGGDVPAPAGMYPTFPALEFDTFYCSADADLSDGAPPPTFFQGPVTMTCHKEAVWFDNVNTGTGTFTIARYSITPFDVSCGIRIQGYLSDRCSGSAIPFIAGPIQPPLCENDLDCDDDVDLEDLAVLLAAYGVDNGGDLDHDGDTDLSDLAILLGDYGCGY